MQSWETFFEIVPCNSYCILSLFFLLSFRCIILLKAQQQWIHIKNYSPNKKTTFTQQKISTPYLACISQWTAYSCRHHKILNIKHFYKPCNLAGALEHWKYTFILRTWWITGCRTMASWMTICWALAASRWEPWWSPLGGAAPHS